MGVVTKQNIPERIKTRLRRGDMVQVIAGKDKGKKGRIMRIDHKTGRVVVQNINMVSKHQKAKKQGELPGILKMEAPLAISNVMYLFKGKPTRLGVKLEEKTVNGRTVIIKTRIAKKTGDAVD